MKVDRKASLPFSKPSTHHLRGKMRIIFVVKHRAFKSLLVLLVIALCIGLLYTLPYTINEMFKASRSNPIYTFTLGESPPFLAEALAVAKARDALDLDGLEASSWIVQEDKRSKSPDGKPDRYLLRNSINPNQGSVDFVRADNRARRIVMVELKGNTVECQVWHPK